MPRDLSGVWTADDGGTYYLQQFDQAIWWLGQSDDGSLQRGLVFTNVLRGQVSSGGIEAATGEGSFVFGSWADVPRGETMNFGDLSLSIEFDSEGNPVRLVRLVETGGFSGSTWTFQTADPDRTFPKIGDVFRKVVKNTWTVNDFWDIFDPARETLKDNLEVVKEPVTLFGTLEAGEGVRALPFVNSFPPSQEPSRDNFLDLNDPYDTAIFDTDSSDADMTCHLTLDPNDLPPDLFEGMSDAHRQEVRDKIGSIHPEMVMFARGEGDSDPALLPGWAESGGNSILLNGRPIEGAYEIADNQAVISIGSKALSPSVGQPARVTGVMSFDIGHDERPLEIHPVYSFEAISATPRNDWSGVWGDSNGFTYYLHQVFGSFWMFVTTPFRDLTFVAVFQGETQDDGVTVLGGWSTVPISATVGFGDMKLVLDAGKLRITVGDGSPLAGRILRKLYDANGHPCPGVEAVKIRLQNARICEVKEIEGASVIYEADDPAFANQQGVQYTWSTTGGQILGSNSLSQVEIADLPKAGTPVTVSVDVSSAIGCRFHGERTFTTKSRTEALRLQLWCEIRLSAVALVNSFITPVKALPPPPGTQPEPPSPATLHELERAIKRMEELVERLRHHRQ